MKNESQQSQTDLPAGIFASLFELLPSLAEQETKKVILSQEIYGLPAGLYFLAESYCFNKDCDCRKVMINVIANDTSKILGTVGFGWESEKYYTEWMFGDKKIGRQMAGAYLEPGSAQNILTDCGTKCLKLVKNSLKDPDYVNLIKSHYQSFKECPRKETENNESRSIRMTEETAITLNTFKNGIPFAEIEFLRAQPFSQQILKEIIFALNHAYDETYFDEKNNYYYGAPLWYAIVAEKYIVPELIDPVVDLFTVDNDSWDFLSEQGEYLIGKLAQKFPDLVMKKVTKAIDLMIAQKSKFAYLYLFESFYYADVNKYKKWFLKTLENPDLYWRESFIVYIGALQIKEALPFLREIIETEEAETFLVDYEEVIEELETGHSLYPDITKPYCEKRIDWRKHYANFEDRFHEDDRGYKTLSNSTIKYSTKKIGRNSPCSCGSGKKYKKCCGK